MRSAGQLTREAPLLRGQVNKAARTVHASLSSEEPVMRSGVPEILRHDAASVDMTRAVGGLPLLFGHDRNAPIGIVESVRLENRRLKGDLRFGNSPRAQEVFTDVEDGILRAVSISYAIQSEEPGERGGFVATRWTPYEASIVSVPADPTVGIGRSAPFTNTGNTIMLATQTENLDNAANVRALCQRHRVGEAFANDLIAQRLDMEGSREAILDELARRDEQLGGQLNVRSHDAPRGSDTDRELVIEALVARMGGTAARQGHPYVGSRVTDIARQRLEVAGVRTTGLSQTQLIERAFATSDFPNLLTSSGNRVLRDAYQSYPGGLKRAARPSTVRDFRAKQTLRLSETPALLRVTEHGEFKHGAMLSTKESYSLGTFGRIVSITRQAMINDDLSAFESLSKRFAQAAVEYEAGALVALLTSNPTMQDAVALFHASHGNLAGSAAAPSVATLGAARLAMRLQNCLDGATAIDATPKYFIVPAALETTAEQLLAQIQPALTTSVNPFAGKLELIVEPRLDAVSSTAWYLATDPMLVDTFEYSYLEGGQQGPELIMEEGFDIDGTAIKCRLDFGCGILDWRGLYRNAGV